MEKKKNITLEYILQHKRRIIKWAEVFIDEIRRRASVHDDSKLEEPEISGWKAMDKEPRCPYGSKEYNDKINRYKWLMELHWRRNRHHPEYWQIWEDRRDRDLIDYLEMLIDWLSYSDKKLTYTQARELVARQVTRYHMDDPNDPINNPPMSQLLLNTISNYFVDLGGLEEYGLKKKEWDDIQRKLIKEEKYLTSKKGVLVDINI